MKLNFELFIFVIFCCESLCLAEENELKLELLQVLFRHGDRVADKKEIYKTDPYADVFKQTGLGQLTDKGKQREYKIGRALRERFESFLKDLKMDEIFAYSTDKERTKMSLKLALAGLYSAKADETWDKSIFTLPISLYYRHSDMDFLRYYIKCHSFDRMLSEVEEKEPEIRSKLEKYQDFLAYLKNSTGMNKMDLHNVFRLKNNLHSLLSLNLSLPSWCSKDDLNKIEELSRIRLETATFNSTLAKVSTGPIIETFLKNVNDHKKDNITKKLYLYSGHDANVGTVIHAHNFTGVPLLPDYGTTIVFEKLRGSENQVYLRISMYSAVSEKWIPLKLPNCEYECPLSEYVNIMKWVLPDDANKICEMPKDPLNELLRRF